MSFTKILLHRLLDIDIVRVFSLNAMSTFIRMLAGMISVKVVAIIIGPAGIALLGQLNNFNAVILGLANGGINAGVTKYVAEYKNEKLAVVQYLSTALRIICICSLIISAFLIIGCLPLSRLVLLSDEYYYVFVVFGFTIILYTLNGFFVSILNGYKQYKKYVRVNILGTILGLVYSITLVFCFGLSGALINAVTFQSIMLFVSLWMCRSMPWMKWSFFKERMSRPIVRKYFGFSLMAFTALLLSPTSQMFIRGYVISELSATDAGIWEGMNRISAMYLNVITTAFSVYYLPRLSEISDEKELHHEVLKCYKVIIPILLISCGSIFILRRFILWLLFTPDFYSMENLFMWQLSGDVFKISSWLLAYILIAKTKTILYISMEILFTFLLIILSLLFLNFNGIVGLAQSYLCNYIFYFIAMALIFRKLIFLKDECKNYRTSKNN